MSEYIGVRGDVVGCDKGGKPLYSMYLTDEEIVRCRDCAYHTQEVRYESVQCYCEYFDFYAEDDNGFCDWAERRKND